MVINNGGILETDSSYLEKKMKIGEVKKASPKFLILIRVLKFYSCNENTMRGAAKSLATLPCSFYCEYNRVNEMVDASIFQFNSRHQSDFSISS